MVIYNKKRGQIPVEKNCMEFAMQHDSVVNFEEIFHIWM